LFWAGPFASIAALLNAAVIGVFTQSVGLSVDFSLSEEQGLLKDSIDRLVGDVSDVERHRRLSRSELGFDAAVWQQYAELGWLCVPFTEAQGGIDGTAVDVMIICEALGRGLMREPYLPTVITGGGFLRRGGSPEQQQRFIPGIIDGSQQWAFAFAETGSYDLGAVASTAQSSDSGYQLTGSKLAVLNGHCADHLVVSASIAGEGVSLFLVDATAAGVNRRPVHLVDGSLGADISFDNVQLDAASLLGAAGEGVALMESVIDESIVAMGAEALGAMQVLLDDTVEYTRTREQFGQPIGKFQALQHRMAEMYLKIEEMRSLLFYAAIKMAEGSAESSQACAALKVKLAESGRLVSQQAVQLHGGIGMTDELAVSHYFKRIHLLARLYGDEAYYLQRYMDLSDAEPVARAS
jgi:alkylation response protein AidB-like acyl-CoA dehydrogenase